MNTPVLAVCTAILVIATLVPLSRNPVWWVRALDFPRGQLVVLSVVLLGLSLWRLDLEGTVELLMLAAQIGCLAYHLVWIAPYTFLAPREVRNATREGTHPHVRILSFNVLTPNRRVEDLLCIIRREDPDVVITVETDRWWQEQLSPLRETHPHGINCPLDNLYGMHLFSRYPLEDAALQFLVEEGVPSIHALVVLPNQRRIRLHCLHPAPPSPTENESSSERDAELVMVGRSVADSPHPVIVTGDLNDVAWSRTTRLFRKLSGLLDPRVGRGMFNTYHARIPLFRWPLDHIFHSKDFTLLELHRLEACGSDHFPVLIDLALEDPKAEAQRDGGLDAQAEDLEEAEEKTRAEGVSPSAVHQPGESRRA